MKRVKERKNRGSALLITIVVMSVIIAAGLGVASIFMREIRLSTFTDDSVIAIIAADAGIEKKLYAVRKLAAPHNARYSQTLSNGATYEACPIPPGQTCNPGSGFVRVEGEINNTRRALEITNIQ